MARRRMIAPEIWLSEDFSKLSLLAKLLFIGMFSQADDQGRGRAKPVYLKSILFPYDEKLRVADVETALSEIALNMSVALYSVAGSSYYEFQNWKKWQTIDRPKPSELPPREAGKPHDEAVFPVAGKQPGKDGGIIGEASATNRRQAGEPSPTDTRLKRKEREIEIEKKIPPISPQGEPPGAKKKAEPAAPDYSQTHFSPAMIAKVDEWLDYKQEKHQPYKPTGLKSLITQIQKQVDRHGEGAVIQLMDGCMAANYQGIIWDKLDKGQGSAVRQPEGSGNPFADYLRDRQSIVGAYDYQEDKNDEY